MKSNINPSSDIQPQTESGAGSESTPINSVDRLLSRISRNKDLPSFSKYIIEINRKLSADTKHLSASELSNIILKDYAFATKLLKLVNSAYYSLFRGKITTITRAVVLLGFEKVSMAAASLLLFEHLKSKYSVPELKEGAVMAFWSGLIAKDVAKMMGLEEGEEAFICAMLYNLGKQIVLFYLPKESTEIRKLVLKNGVNEATASKSVLGVSFEELGVAIAQKWNLPDKIVNSMIRLSRKELQSLKGKSSNALQGLSNFSNELCHIINDTAESKREASFSALLTSYQKHISLSKKQLSGVVDASMEKVKKHADVLSINIENSRFLSRLPTNGQKQLVDVQGKNQDGDLELNTKMALVDSISNSEASNMVARDTKEPNQVDTIISGIQDMSAAMIGKYEINDIALIALESMYRGFGFDRAVFFIMNKNKKQLSARFGYGMNIELIVNRFSFEIAGTQDIFNIALAKQKDIIIPDSEAEHIRQLIPQWFRDHFKALSFVFLPILYEKTCIGAFYADCEKSGAPLPEGQYKYLDMLRNQLLLAIKYH
jgi:eukaryotic-like serine/threonine-protein kinase